MRARASRARPPGVAGRPERKRRGVGPSRECRAHRGRTASSSRPGRVRAPIEALRAARGAAVCQPQPASTRSSRAERRRRAAHPVVGAQVAAAVVGAAHQRAQPRVVARAAVVEPGVGEVHDAARRRRAAGAATPPRRRRWRSARRTGRRAPSAPRRSSMFALHTSSASRSLGAEVERRDRRLLAPAARGAGPSKRARIGPPNASASGCRAAPSTSARSQPGGACTSSSTSAIEVAPRPRAMPVLRAAFGPVPASRSQRAARPRRSAAAARARVGAVVHDDHLVRLGEVLIAQRAERDLQVAGAVLGRHDDRHDGWRHAARLPSGPCARGWTSRSSRSGRRRGCGAPTRRSPSLVRRAGASCEIVPVRIGASGKLRRHMAVTDLVEALAARRSARGIEARAVVYSTITAALLQPASDDAVRRSASTRSPRSTAPASAGRGSGGASAACSSARGC